jgi:hypothetical protein
MTPAIRHGVRTLVRFPVEHHTTAAFERDATRGALNQALAECTRNAESDRHPGEAAPQRREADSTVACPVLTGRTLPDEREPGGSKNFTLGMRAGSLHIGPLERISGYSEHYRQ